MAGYRKAYEGRGRVWLTMDGVEVASFCEFEFENAWREEGRRERKTGWPFTETAYVKIRASGMRDRSDFLDAIGTCIGNSIAKLLNSPDPTVRALAMLDRRLGKRRLARIDGASDHPLVAQFYRLRCEAEGIRKPPSRSQIPSPANPH
jgi:hypothetical protein